MRLPPIGPRARRSSVALLLLSLVALTFPGIVPFNRIRPYAFGLPFNLAWIAAWVLIGGAALWIAERAERP